jgi:hypothetical protein
VEVLFAFEFFCVILVDAPFREVLSPERSWSREASRFTAPLAFGAGGETAFAGGWAAADLVLSLVDIV